MPLLEVIRVIEKPADCIYKMICDIESFPLYMKTVKNVRVIEQSDNKTISLWTVDIDGLELNWQELEEYFPGEQKICYHQITGDMARYEGSWIVDNHPQGALVKLKVDFELGIPFMAGMLQYLLLKKVKDNCEDMLKWLDEAARTIKISVRDLKT